MLLQLSTDITLRQNCFSIESPFLTDLVNGCIEHVFWDIKVWLKILWDFLVFLSCYGFIKWFFHLCDVLLNCAIEGTDTIALREDAFWILTCFANSPIDFKVKLFWGQVAYFFLTLVAKFWYMTWSPSRCAPSAAWAIACSWAWAWALAASMRCCWYCGAWVLMCSI